MAIAQSVERWFLDRLSVVAESVNAPDNEGVGQAVNTSHAAGPGQTKVVFLTLEEINAWMDQRLRDWASNQGSEIPDYISDPMVAIEGDNLVFAFQFDKPEFRQVVSAVTKVEINKQRSDESEQARIRVVEVRMGRLGLSAVRAVGGADESSALAEIATGITDALDGKVFDPVVRINRQKVRAVSFKLKHEPLGMELTLKAEKL